MFIPGIISGLLVGITVHEAAHAYMAYLLGDHTAKIEGRVTLNPFAHLDPLGTLMIFLTFLSGVGFGWGKPVPYNPHHLKNPRWGAFWIALAGPSANFICAIFFAFIIKILPIESFLWQISASIIFMNIALMAFNLLPIPPLDGSKLLPLIVPEKYDHYLDTYFRNGPIILLTIIMLQGFTNFDILGRFIGPIFYGTLSLLGLA